MRGFVVLTMLSACAPAVVPPPVVIAEVPTPIVTDAAPEPEPIVIPAAAVVEPEYKPCQNGVCLFLEPAQPRPGDLVMAETPAAPGLSSAMVSIYGRDVRMFRHGDRFRAFVGVPLKADKKTYGARLWVSGEREPDGKSYSCLPHVVSDRAGGSESLNVSRKFVGKNPQHEALGIEPNTTWVDPLDRPPFSELLYVWPRDGAVTSNFGISRVFNKRLQSRHMGLDIHGDIGDRVFATQTGVVRWSGRLRSTGNTVVIDHGGGVLSFYMHLSQRLKNEGAKVKQGELIGYVGKTGRVTGPHLHFATSVHGRFVDPESVLSHSLVTSAPGLPCLPDPSSHSVR